MNKKNLIQLVIEKKRLLEKFLELTQEQQNSISKKDYDNVFDVLIKKQSIMERINLLDLEMEAIPVDYEANVEEVRLETRDIVTEALKVDAENIKVLQQNKVVIAEKIKEAKQNRKTHSLYRGKNATLGALIVDRKR